MRRVVVLTPGAYGVRGGIGQHSRDLIQALARIEDISEVIVVPREAPLLGIPEPHKVSFLRKAAGGKLIFFITALEAMKSNPHLIICTHLHLLPVAVFLKQRLKVSLVLIAHGIEAWAPRKFGARFLLRTCDAIWCVSVLTRDRMNAWAQLPIDRYTVIPNAVHLDQYDGLPPNSTLRDRLGLEGRKVLLTVARLPGYDRYKGVDEVLESLPNLVEREPTISYLVVGDGEDRPRLEQKSRSLNVNERVLFTGYVSEEVKPDYYRLADVFVLPGRGEGFGIVFLEALACGLPVVGSLLDGSREALRDGLLGELVDPRDPKSVQNGILRALGRPKLVPEGLAYFSFPRFAERIERGLQAV